MDTANDHSLLRRDFLKLAAMTTGGLLVASWSHASGQAPEIEKHALDRIPKLNLAFRIKEISANKIELYTHNSSGERLKHPFEGLEADLLREIVQEKKLKAIIDSLAEKHRLSIAVCRDRVEGFLRELEEARLVYYGDTMLVKIVEVKNAK
jgi:hypothetical protein